MLSIMSKSPSARPTPHIVLNTIWKVEADESYHGRYGPTHQSCYIAIRTVDGVGEVKVDKTVHILRKNSLLVFRYDDMSYYEPAQDKWDFYWFEFEGSIPAVPLSVTVETEPYADDNEIMEQCFLSLSFPSEAAYVSTLFSSLLLRWLRGYEGEDTVEEGIIGASVEHLINNPEKCPTVSELSAHAGMGERSFRELFKRLIGVSPKEYISEMRIKNAEELLLTTSMSIKEISASLGFSNQYYFSNFFKKKKGVYPEAFRNNFGGV